MQFPNGKTVAPKPTQFEEFSNEDKRMSVPGEGGHDPTLGRRQQALFGGAPLARRQPQVVLLVFHRRRVARHRLRQPQAMI